MTTHFTPWTTLRRYRHHPSSCYCSATHERRIRFIQRLFIPPRPVGRVYRTVLGTSRFRHHTSFHPNRNLCRHIDIAFIFGALPLHRHKRQPKEMQTNTGSMWAYSQAGMLLQWAFGGLSGLLVLASPDMALEPCLRHHYAKPGYCGGHGTAAAIGEAFSEFGYDDILNFGHDCRHLRYP